MVVSRKVKKFEEYQKPLIPSQKSQSRDVKIHSRGLATPVAERRPPLLALKFPSESIPQAPHARWATEEEEEEPPHWEASCLRALVPMDQVHLATESTPVSRSNQGSDKSRTTA